MAVTCLVQKFRACGLNQIVGAKWHKRQVVTSVCQELRRGGGERLSRQKGSYLAFFRLSVIRRKKIGEKRRFSKKRLHIFLRLAAAVLLRVRIFALFY